jgi:hypothetical protein
VTGTVNVTVNQQLAGVMVTPATATVQPGGQQTFFANAFDQFHNAMPAPIAWSVASGPGTIEGNGRYTAPSSGGGTAVIQATATVNGLSVSGTATVTVQQALTITSISATPNPVTDTTATLNVTATDPNGGTLFYSWLAFNPSGGPLPTFSSTTSATTTVTFYQAGTYNFQVMVYDQAGLSTQGTVNVTVNQQLAGVTVTPATATVQDGAQEPFLAYAFDQFHFSMPAAIAWSLASGPGTIDGNGNYTAPTTGSGTVVVQAAATVNGVTVNGTATVTLVQAQQPTITSTSAAPNLTTGTTATMSVSATNPAGGTLAYNWTTVSQPAGSTAPTISAGQSATATATFHQAGTYQFRVTVTNQTGQTATTTVTVTISSKLTGIVLTPATATVHHGSQQQFTAYAVDQFQRQMAAPLSWSLASGPGTITSSGLYTAPAYVGATAVVRVKATVNGIIVSRTASVTIT